MLPDIHRSQIQLRLLFVKQNRAILARAFLPFSNVGLLFQNPILTVRDEFKLHTLI